MTEWNQYDHQPLPGGPPSDSHTHEVPKLGRVTRGEIPTEKQPPERPQQQRNIIVPPSSRTARSTDRTTPDRREPAPEPPRPSSRGKMYGMRAAAWTLAAAVGANIVGNAVGFEDKESRIEQTVEENLLKDGKCLDDTAYVGGEVVVDGEFEPGPTIVTVYPEGDIGTPLTWGTQDDPNSPNGIKLTPNTPEDVKLTDAYGCNDPAAEKPIKKD
jgi:hypothetical protein